MSRIIVFSLGLLVAHSIQCQLRFTETFQVNFEKDIDTLTDFEILPLVNKLASIQQYNIHKLIIKGHTDGDGSQAYNIDLSKRRSTYVKNFLGDLRYRADTIQTDFYGENRKLVKETSEEFKSKNRRVELILDYIKINSIQDIFESIQPDFTQVFRFDSSQLVLKIKAKKGTEFAINREDLIYEDGSPISNNDKIEVKVDEIQSFLDQFQANISTESSDGKILESGGMFNLELEANSKKLKMKEGKEYTASLPNKFKTDNMNVFVGVKDANQVMKWEKTEDKFENKEVVVYENVKAKLNIESMDSWYLKPKLSRYLIHKDYSFKIPIKPEKQSLPCEPRKPFINNAMYQPSLVQNIFLSKKNIDSIKEYKIKPDMERYYRQMEHYTKRYKRKTYLVEEYKKAIEKYNTDVIIFNKNLDSLYKDIMNYKLAWMEKTYIQQLAYKKSKALELSRKDSFFEHNLDELLSAKSAFICFRGDAYYKSLNKTLIDYFKEFHQIKDPRQIAFDQFRGCSEEVAETNRKFYQVLNHLKSKSLDSALAFIDNFSKDKIVEEKASRNRVVIARQDLFQANLSKFNWINCDRFYDLAKLKKQEYKVLDAEFYQKYNPTYYAIIPEINSSIFMHNSYLSLPKHLKGMIISYYLDEKKNINYAKKEISPVHDKNFKLEYTKLSQDEFLKEMKSL